MCLSLLIACLGLCGCQRQLPPEQARDLLQRVQTARRTLPVQGQLTTSIRLRDEQLQAQAEVHRGPGAIHMKYTTGRFAGWQVIEQDGLVWRVSPEGQPAPSPMSPEGGLGLRGQADLRVQFTGNVQVAGRKALQYVLQPPGRSQARAVIAVDAQTSFPLSLQRYDSSGRLVSETVYSQINYQVAVPARVKPPEVAQAAGQGRGGGQRGRKAGEQELQQALGGPLFKPTYLPQGFVLRGFFAHDTRRGQVAEIRYSDGRRMLTVAQLKRPERQAAPRPANGQQRQGWGGRRQPARPGGAQAQQPGGWWQRLRGGQAQGPQWGQVQKGPFGRRLIRELRGSRVVIVSGDVPDEELRRVMQSIPYPPGQQPSTRI
jgi:hypothetical protein